MNDEHIEELKAEYERLKAAEATMPTPDSLGNARKQLHDFCLATGKDITLMNPVFNIEDLEMANVAS